MSFTDNAKHREAALIETVKMSVASQIKVNRVSRGWTQEKFGKIVGMTQEQVSKLESGREMPNLSTLLKIAEKLDVALIVRMVPFSRSEVSVAASFDEEFTK